MFSFKIIWLVIIFVIIRIFFHKNMLWAIEFNMIIFIKSNYFCVSANLKQLSFLYVFKRLNNNPTLKIASLKVSKSRKQFLELSILPKNERKTRKSSLRALRIIFLMFRSFFGRNENSKFFFEIYWPLGRSNPIRLADNPDWVDPTFESGP